MEKIILTPHEIILLQRACKDRFNQLFHKIELRVKSEDCDEISDLVNDLFLEIGLEKNSEPNKTGIDIERLMDKFLRN